jgi:subtilase family serine protease
MIQTRRVYAIVLSVIALLAASSIALLSQNTGRRSEAVIRDAVDENKLVVLHGNTRSEANGDNDLGAVGNDLAMEHMMLQLKRPAAQEQAAEQFIADLHDPKSPNFHKWLTAAEYGKNFGVNEADVKNITNWLESHGFVVNSVYPSGMVIDFSGTAGQVSRAFHTSIHHLDVNGEQHIANMTDPQIPAALAPAVTGIVALHDFKPHKMSRPKFTYTYQRQIYQAVVPADLATIYDFTPLFAKGTTGKGQTIVVVEDTDLYTSDDWTAFQSTFGLTQYGGTLTTVHPAAVTGTNNCKSPGVNSDDSEAILDVEWASAAAPGAAIIMAACDNTRSTFGGFIALQNMINASNPPAIFSVSYGVCEAENGNSSNAAISSIYQQAVAEGISVFVAAGDEGAAACDANLTSATHGIGVNGYASTPYNVAVGGTDFADAYDGTTNTFWANKNSATYGSALSYIPEIPWNGSCASGLLASYSGFSTVYGSNGFCNSNTARQNGFVSVSGGSGGPSGCATGVPSTPGVVSGSCKGVAKPSWQAGVSGIAGDGVRDLPDISMFASNGVWGPYYVTCYSDPNFQGTPCTGDPSTWGGFGGTSVSSPIMAGIQALINQTTGASQGNPNPVYYALAASTPSAFHPVTRGDIDQNCGGAVNCYGALGFSGPGRGGRPSETSVSGALSTTSGSFTPAYATTTAAWNFATGLGSVDVNVLVTSWPKH